MSYYLVGHPLGHSFSPRLHALLGNPDFHLKDLDASELTAFLRSGGFDGLNVTIPYKQTVLSLCDRLSEKAQATGAVNTVVREADGSLFGDNTDITGLINMADRAGVSFEGRVVLILGTGGTAHTAWYTAQAGGAAKIYRVSRSGPINYENVYRTAENAQIVINTTPVGMYPHQYEAPLLDLSRLPRLEAVLDVVYRPLRTRLTLEAEKRGLKYANGLRMLVEQACAAEELFLDRPVSVLEADRAYRAMVREQADLILIGMPGSGKTSVGKLLSRAPRHRDRRRGGAAGGKPGHHAAERVHLPDRPAAGGAGYGKPSPFPVPAGAGQDAGNQDALLPGAGGPGFSQHRFPG